LDDGEAGRGAIVSLKSIAGSVSGCKYVHASLLRSIYLWKPQEFAQGNFRKLGLSEDKQIFIAQTDDFDKERLRQGLGVLKHSQDVAETLCPSAMLVI